MELNTHFPLSSSGYLRQSDRSQVFSQAFSEPKLLSGDVYRNTTELDSGWTPPSLEQLDSVSSVQSRPDEDGEPDSFQVKKPADNDSRTIRNDILGQLGFTKDDILEYDRQHPTPKGGQRPDNDGFYVSNVSPGKDPSGKPIQVDSQAWATRDQVKKWPPDSQGRISVPVSAGSVAGLKDFVLQRRTSEATAAIQDPALRRRVQTDLSGLFQAKTETEREAAYARLTQNQSLSPGQRQEISGALGRLSETSAQSGNPWLKLAQANYSHNPEFVGPRTESTGQLLSDAGVLADDPKNALSRSEKARFYRQSAQLAYTSGDQQGRRNSEMLERFNSMSLAERLQARRTPGLNIPRTPPGANNNVPSVSSVSEEKAELEKFEKENGLGPVYGGETRMVKKDLAEDPNKVTYPGRNRMESRHRQIGALAAVPEEFNKWVGLYAAMRDSSAKIAKWEELRKKARVAEFYPVPPKPEALPEFRRQLETYYGKEEAAKIHQFVARASQAFWSDRP